VNPIIAKIEKLLRLSQDQDGTPEGETAAKLAHRMMAAHAIEMSSIDLDKQAEHDPMERQCMKVPASVWRRRLANHLAKHCNCKTAYHSSHGAGQQIYMYGHRTDIEVLRYLYEICERQIQQAARQYVNGLDPDWYDRGEKKSLGNDFRRSAVDGLRTKLNEIRKGTQEENAEGFALVVGRKQRVDDWVNQNYTFTSGNSGHYSHNDAGYSAGRRVSLSAGMSGSGSTKRLGGE
tara:strand:+ start:1687 stop:2388 length:702 start_codon:yes stop_codon:yes gene_type:complete